ncbi:MAG: hydrogenase formation protein HypD [Coriobacteriales bacterium]|jgi:hydrogenase expression/formation protein HypD|nr:hydrogenase formation protein HypD [Coriobacteriales bacterium]
MDTAFLNKFKDPALSRGLVDRIKALSQQLEATPGNKTLNLMEVCGTHTVAIAKSGLRSVLPKNIKLISGPGCPVCVTANNDIDRIIAATRLPQVTVTTFGDMIRVPGSSTSLQERRAEGASVEVVYSPLDALNKALENPEQQIIFIGVGFETTTPLVAATVKRAQAAGIENFSVLTAHKRVTPALDALARDSDIALDGLILPGHVSTIIGSRPYRFLADCYGIPSVIAGFEPVDLLLAITQLLEQIVSQKSSVEIAYGRAVHEEGNEQACAVIDEVFTPAQATWRGLGAIPDSAHVLKDEYARFDALRRFDLQNLTEPTVEPRGCRCGDVLKGIMAPSECSLFGTACTPAHPVGPCMVSGEGSCAAYYKYQIEV